MKSLLKLFVVLVGVVVGYEILHLFFFKDIDGWAILSFMEEPVTNGTSKQTVPENRGQFEKVLSFDGELSVPLVDGLVLLSLAGLALSTWMLAGRSRAPANPEAWKTARLTSGLFLFTSVTYAMTGSASGHRQVADDEWKSLTDKLHVGDVIAYRKEKWRGRREILASGKLTVIGYRLFKYGHLAIVVEDPKDPMRKVLFTSQSKIGVNVDEDVDTLRIHNWDAYRLDKWDRVNEDRFKEYVNHCLQAAGHFFGYDFTGMFALWNDNLRPTEKSNIGSEYICSTSVLTILYYAGFESDAIKREGWFDLVTPYQVVKADGRFIPLPEGGVIQK
ncbi:MAG: hypothetical protein CMI31_15860 [Opitutae bacterium]|nr:hypothetical protein [Opitutae bacterium]